MVATTSSIALTPVSFLVLGIVARAGEATPYDLKREVGRSVGNFWSFPHSQLYAEPARLADAGLLAEQREPEGRRRRTYTITALGRDALVAWLRELPDERTEIRDLGLLKLFFADLLDAEDVTALARSQEAMHRERLSHYEHVDRHLAGRDDRGFPRVTLRMGILCERAFVRFWSDLAADPRQGGAVATPPAGSARPAARGAAGTTGRRRRS